jgi:hypothetical protein
MTYAATVVTAVRQEKESEEESDERRARRQREANIEGKMSRTHQVLSTFGR